MQNLSVTERLVLKPSHLLDL